jgi:hypothetical protein
MTADEEMEPAVNVPFEHAGLSSISSNHNFWITYAHESLDGLREFLAEIVPEIPLSRRVKEDAIPVQEGLWDRRVCLPIPVRQGELRASRGLAADLLESQEKYTVPG